jgi:ATP/maltotriose-dependent transcriptional regulator MalT
MAQDLRFADQDATILQHAAGLGLTLSRSRSWSPGPKGWAIGLRFAALALRCDKAQGLIARFTGREEAVAGYLTGEVMTSCPLSRISSCASPRA